MKSKDFIKKIEAGESVVGYYIVPSSYLCGGFVKGTGTLKINGYYPFKITGFGIKPAGKIYFKTELVDKIGFLNRDNESVRRDWDQYFEFYSSEDEAIQECSLRNRGKKSPGPCCQINLTAYDETYRALKFY